MRYAKLTIGLVCVWVTIGVLGCESQQAQNTLEPTAVDHFERALQYEAQEDYQLAIKEYRLAVKDKPADSSAYVNLGRLYAREGQEARAEEYYRQATRVNPDDPRGYNLIGGIYMRQEKYGRAIAYYRRALELDPAFADVHWNMAAAYRSMGMKRDAMRHYRRYMAMTSSDDAEDVGEAERYLQTRGEE